MAILTSGFITIKDFNDITSSPTAPTSPVIDQVWLDTSVEPPVLKTWNGSSWVETNGVTIGGRNLLRNTALINESFFTFVSETKLDKSMKNGSNNSIKYQTTVSDSTVKIGATPQPQPVVFGEYYSASAEIYLPATHGMKDYDMVALEVQCFNSIGGLITSYMTYGDKKTIGKWVKLKLENQVMPVGTVEATARVVVQGKATLWVSNLQLERGSKVSDWTPSPEDVTEEINDAKNKAEEAEKNALESLEEAREANKQLSDMASDSILTPSEKQNIARTWEEIKVEKPLISKQAEGYKVSTATYDSVFNALQSYVNTLGLDLTTNTDIAPVTFNAKFNDYYTERQLVLNKIAEESKKQSEDYTDSALEGVVVGGRNFLKYSDLSKSLVKSLISTRGSSHSVSIDTNTKYMDKNTLKIVASTSGGNNQDVCWISVLGSQQGTGTGRNFLFSFYAKADRNMRLKARVAYGSYKADAYVDITTAWERHVIDISEISNANAGGEVIFHLTSAGTVWMTMAQLEDGTKVTDWTKAIEDYDDDMLDILQKAEEAEANAQKGIEQAEQAKDRLDEIADDSKLTATEKQQIARDWEEIKVEKESIVKQANVYGVSTTNYVNAYNTLGNYINGLSLSSQITTTINKTTFNSTFNSYYSQRQTVLNDIATKTKEYANTVVDGVVIGGTNLMTDSTGNLGSFSTGNVVNGYMGNKAYRVRRTTTGNSARQQIQKNVTLPSLNVGDSYTLSGWIFIDEDVTLNADNNQLYMRCYRKGSDNFTDICINNIPKSSPKGKWFRVEATSKLAISDIDVNRCMVSMALGDAGSIRFSMIKLERGTKASDWSPANEDLTNAYAIMLSNEAQVIPTYNDRTPMTSQTYSTKITVYQGVKERTDFTIGSASSANGITVSKNDANKTVSFAVNTNTKLTTDNGEFNIPITVDGKTFNKVFSWAVAKQGVQGSSAQTVALSGEQVFKYTNNFTGTPTPSSIKIQASVQNISNPTYVWTFRRAGETEWFAITSATNANQNYYTLPHDNSTIFNSNSVKSVTIRCAVGDKYDELTIVKVSDGAQGAQGAQGIQGIKGQDGQSTYFHVRYSANANGNPMTEAPTSTTEYMGTVSTTSSTAPTSYSSYKWSKIKGQDGEQGIQGVKGEDGRSSYLHIKYSNDGKTFTSNNGETLGVYIGTYVDYVEADSSNFNDYTWKKYVGEDGKGISTITNYYLASASGSGVAVSTSGWTTGIQNTTITKKYLWNYELIRYTDNSTTTTTPVIIGTHGATGDTGKGISSIAEYYLATSSASGVTTSTSGWTTAIQTTTTTNRYLWNYEVITYTDNTKYTGTPRIIGTHGATGDTGNAGKDAYTVILTNENHTFPASSTGNIASAISTTSDVVAYKGATSVTPTIGTITNPSGMTITKSGTRLTFQANAGASLANTGSVTIPVTVDGQTFNKVFSWSKAKEGVNAKSADIMATGQVFKSSDGGTTYAPSAITLTPSLQNVSFSNWQYSTTGTGSWTTVVSGQNGLTISSNALVISKDSPLFTKTQTSIVFRLKTNDSTIYDTMTIVKLNDVADLEIGTKNLLLDTALAKGGQHWDFGSKWSIINAESDKSMNKIAYFKNTDSTSTWQRFSTKVNMAVTPNDKMTFSFDVKVISDLAKFDERLMIVRFYNTDTTDDYSDAGAFSKIHLGRGAFPTITAKNTWYTVSHTFTVPANAKRMCIGFQCHQDGEAKFRCLKLEKGSKATDWSPAPEDIKADISTAQNAAESAQSTANSAKTEATNVSNKLAEIASDNKLTASEKQQVSRDWEEIKLEKPSIINQANVYSISTTAFTNAYTALETYIGTLNLTNTSTTTITPSDFKSKFNTYYTQRQVILDEVAKKAKKHADDLVANVNIGGRNLARKGSVVKYSSSSTATTVDDANFTTDGSVIISRTAVINEGAMIDRYVVYDEGVNYVATFKMRTTSGTVSNIHFYNGRGHKNSKVYIDGAYKGTMGQDLTFPNDTNYHTVEVQFEAVATDSSTANAQNTQHIIPQPMKSTASAYTVQILNLKIERGNKPTDWTPAPEDVTTTIESLRGDVNTMISGVQDQVDGKVETFYQADDPASAWTTTALKNAHKGDIWYNSSSQMTYRYSGTGWVKLADGDAESAKNLASTKKRVFTATPTVPYEVGDLWVTTLNSTGDLKVCKTTRTTGSYTASDWVNATDYIDSTQAGSIAQGKVDAQTQASIFNKLTNNGATQGIFLDGGKVWINGEYIKANSITADRLSISDFTNYAQLNDNTATKYGFTKGSDEAGGAWLTRNSMARDIFISDYYSCNGGESFRIKYDISTTIKGNSTSGGTDSTYRGTAIGLYCYDGTGKSVGIVYSTRYTNQTVSGSSSTVTIPTTARKFRVFIQTESYGNWSGTLKVRNIQVTKMAGGELIVDGSITATKIASRTITADKIQAGAITANEIKAGAITANKLHADVLSANNIVSTINGGSTNISGNKIRTGSISSTNGKSTINLDNGAMNLGSTSDSSYLQWTGSALNIKANSINIGASSVATSAELKQTATDFTYKFTQSGGYNLLKNGKATLNTNFWASNGGGIGRDADSIFKTCFKTSLPTGIRYTGGDDGGSIRLKNDTHYVFEAMIYSRTVIGGSTTTPLHFWCNTAANTAGQTQCTIIDYKQEVPSINTWTKCYVHFLTKPSGEVWFTPMIYTGGSLAGDIWVTELSLSESSVQTPWTPHPSEIYDGITQIDKDGIKVSTSKGAYTHFSADGMNSYDNDGNMTLGLRNGGMTFHAWNNHEYVGYISQTAISSSGYNGVSLGMTPNGDYLSFGVAENATDPNAGFTQAGYMVIAPHSNNGSNKQGINMFKHLDMHGWNINSVGIVTSNGFYANNNIKLKGGSALFFDADATYPSTIWEETSDGAIRMYGDNGIIMGYLNGSSGSQCFYIKEAQDGLGCRIGMYDHLNMNGWRIKNATVNNCSFRLDEFQRTSADYVSIFKYSNSSKSEMNIELANDYVTWFNIQANNYVDKGQYIACFNYKNGNAASNTGIHFYRALNCHGYNITNVGNMSVYALQSEELAVNDIRIASPVAVATRDGEYTPTLSVAKSIDDVTEAHGVVTISNKQVKVELPIGLIFTDYYVQVTGNKIANLAVTERTDEYFIVETDSEEEIEVFYTIKAFQPRYVARTAVYGELQGEDGTSTITYEEAMKEQGLEVQESSPEAVQPRTISETDTEGESFIIA